MAEGLARSAAAHWIVTERDGITGAERCECFGVRRNAERESRAGIPPNYANATLENSSSRGQSCSPTGSLGVFMEVRRYAKEFPLTDKPGLLLVGIRAPERPTWQLRR